MLPSDDPAEVKKTHESLPANARRRLLRGGLAAGPVLMTVASRPVLGQAIACSPSAADSINLGTSLNHNCTVARGLTPEEWKARAADWPSPYVGDAATASSTPATTTTTTTNSTSTSSVEWAYRSRPSTNRTTTAVTPLPAQPDSTAFHCPTTGLGGRTFAQMSMLDVIDQTGRDSLGRYIVAALLNARSGRTPMLTEMNVRSMWNDLIHRGYYEPTAGSRWGATQIVAYIKTTIA